MPRQVAAQVEKSFVKGLITEVTALNFPENACTETFDCVFDRTGVVTRRLGWDFEDDYSRWERTIETNEVFTEFLWTAVAGNGETIFLVQQIGSTVYFFDVSTTTTASAIKKSFTVNLDSYTATGTTRDPATEQNSYAIGNGDLIIVNPACDPVYVTYLPEQDTISTTEITINVRDFTGIDDGIAEGTRPTETVASLKTNNPKHYYNILNQGWHATDALTQWDAARTDMPNNRDTVALYRSSATDAFDTTLITSKSPGNTPAPKGHFILNPFNTDRTAALVAEGFTGATIAATPADIAGSLGTTFSQHFSFSEYAFDSDTSEATTGAVASVLGGVQLSGHIGKNYSSSPKQITGARVYGTTDVGFISGANPSVTITLYGKTGTAPSSATDGTSLGSTTFTDTADESAGRSITSSDTTSFWDHVWVRIVHAQAGSQIFVAEVVFTTNSSASPDTVTFERPSAVAFYASRVCYSGVNYAGLSNSIFFSQIIEKRDQYGKCYQVNDPTSEDFFDLLASDGGVIKIPEMGGVVKLFTYQTALLAIAANGVWLISGSQGNPFKANDYNVRKLSSVGSFSPMSVADVKGVPIWWAEDGIYTVKFDPSYDSFEVVSVTAETIDQFFIDIPPVNRQYAKGVYDSVNKICYWLYNDTQGNQDYYVYNSVLCLDTLSGAFYPWTITSDTPEIRGIIHVDSNAENLAAVKYTTTVEFSASTEHWTYSATEHTDYLDWPDYLASDYDSYLITGYKLHGNTQRFFQPNYIFTFFNTEEDSSCYVQGIFDFTNSGNSGKWSSAQQVYNSDLTLRDINYSRRKIRGKGRSLQLKYYSNFGCPFNLIGWSLWETQNAGI